MMKDSETYERLRAHGLRPTLARVGILQFVADAGPGAVSVEQVFEQALLRGMKCSLGTTYRTIAELEAKGLLLREWGAGTKALYRLTPAQLHAQPLWLVCRESGRRVALDDADLHARLVAAAAREGFDLGGKRLDVAVDRLEAASPRTPDREPAPRPRLASRRD